MSKKFLKDESRKNFTIENFTIDSLNTGCLMRIADATEKMAANITSLFIDRDRLKSYYDNEVLKNKKLSLKNKRLEKKIKKLS